MTSEEMFTFLRENDEAFAALVLAMNGVGHLMSPASRVKLVELHLVEQDGTITEGGRKIGEPLLQQRSWFSALSGVSRSALWDYLTDDEQTTLRNLVSGKGMVDVDHYTKLRILGLMVSNRDLPSLLGWMVASALQGGFR